MFRPVPALRLIGHRNQRLVALIALQLPIADKYP
jgi:hypothetical protein